MAEMIRLQQAGLKAKEGHHLHSGQPLREVPAGLTSSSEGEEGEEGVLNEPDPEVNSGETRGNKFTTLINMEDCVN